MYVVLFVCEKIIENKLLSGFLLWNEYCFLIWNYMSLNKIFEEYCKYIVIVLIIIS